MHSPLPELSISNLLSKENTQPVALAGDLRIWMNRVSVSQAFKSNHPLSISQTIDNTFLDMILLALLNTPLGKDEN